MSIIADLTTAASLRDQLKEVKLSAIEEKFMEQVESVAAKLDSVLRSVNSFAGQLMALEQWKVTTQESLSRGQEKFDDHEVRMRQLEVKAVQEQTLVRLEAEVKALDTRQRLNDSAIEKGKLISTIIGAVAGIVGTATFGLIVKLLLSGGRP